jgi:two-component sensor histidine kinase
MNRLKQLKIYPFGLFLVLEWIFLGAAIFGELPQDFLYQKYFISSSSNSSILSPLLSLLCLIGLGLMGLKLPKSKRKHYGIQVNKWLYILAQLGLLLLPFALNPESDIFITAYLIIVIRACLIFEWKGSLVATNLIIMVIMVSLKAYQFLVESQELVRKALKDIRHSVSTLRSNPLGDKSLESAIALLFQEFSSRTKIIPDYIIALNHSLTEEIKLTVYRIIQEALTNIVKHSDAQVVKVELQTLPEDLSLLIKDNGKGFNPQLNTTGFGLQGMRERVMALEGKIEISSSLQHGCIIIINIPIQRLS